MQKKSFEFGCFYTHKELQDDIGGNHQFYLSFTDGRILCGRIDPNKNPSAPEIIFIGTKPKNIECAEIFANQSEPVPIFIKRKVNC